jgi:anti-sigma factor RsiW
MHERIWEVLPWYVNGTLTPEETEAVDQHAAVCPRCREELAACRTASQAVAQAGEVAPTPHPVRLARLLARIDRQEKGEGQSGARAVLARLRALFKPAAQPLPWMLAAQVAVLVLIGALLFWPRGGDLPSAQFRTLSAPTAQPAPQFTLRLVFDERATEGEIRQLLLSVRGEITGGPSPFGAYTVAVPATGDSLATVLHHLRGASVVELAEPVAEPNVVDTAAERGDG